ncbi:YqiA/YcfP family alpha/beta fold hydrolase [Paenibacillus sp. BIC5C1]|uniref:YqiA/YcfP family alpha/beta fold hydrolase n=1 Tax=Paenibacillus sp. BIC5C1 TaxID=3078263 RepID=UPI0028EECB87|nr:YqiA/YcfP family alpha/beta fold hydrolase [Paenibacillus sp. BIC5C1]
MFEFYNITLKLDAKKVFIRDIYQSWYHRGLGTSSISNILELKEYVEKLIQISKSNKVVLVGNSMGGYASLLIGRMLNCKDVKVITFNPQTVIGVDNFSEFKETRWNKEMSNLQNIDDSTLLNLNSFFEKNKSNGGEYEIHYSNSDKKHAEVMKDIPEVKLIEYKLDSTIDDHELVKILKNENQLLDILKKGLNTL